MSNSMHIPLHISLHRGRGFLRYLRQIPQKDGRAEVAAGSSFCIQQGWVANAQGRAMYNEMSAIFPSAA